MNNKVQILQLINKENNSLSLKDLLLSDEYEKYRSPFAVPLGLDDEGNIVIKDFNAIQNLLVTGMSTTGKTSLIHLILIFLMLNNNPQDLKIFCVDSMNVEYSLFKNCEYSLYNSKNVSDDICQSMNKIIEETNFRIKSDKILPKIICVIDDFADIQTDCEINKTNKFNDFIELVPLMNKVGIYVILSTSITTRKFITNEIKGIFNNRITFALCNSNDTQLVLDDIGAEKLVENKLGSCLFKTKWDIKHLKCAYINSKDIENILNYINKNN